MEGVEQSLLFLGGCLVTTGSNDSNKQNGIDPIKLFWTQCTRRRDKLACLPMSKY